VVTTSGSTSYAEAAAATVIQANLSLADLDNSSFTGATVTISNSLAGDELAFSNTSSITGTYDSSSGVLTLVGNASKADYQAALRTVTYRSTSTDPTENRARLSRTINFAINDGNTAAELGSANASITITGVNSAPALANTDLKVYALAGGSVPSGSEAGVLLSSLLGGLSDTDTHGIKGAAIEAAVITNGTWYYSVDAGTTWTAIGTVSSSSALLLASNANTRLYFKANNIGNGTLASQLTLRAWDQTSGTAGTKVNPGTTGGTSAYSTTTDMVDVALMATLGWNVPLE
jgi:hypothetical protein